MKNYFYLTIAKIDKVIFSGKVISVNCPGTEGEMTILANHIPLITSLKEGKIRIRINEDEKKELKVKKGIMEVNKNEVIILL